MKKLSVALLLIFLMGLWTGAVWAEDGYNAQLFWPSIFGGNFIAIEDSHTLCPLGFGGGIFLNYANGPVEVRIDGESESDILNQLLTADMLLAFGPFSFMSLGVDVPVHLYTRGRTFGDIEKGTDVSELSSELDLGDIRAAIKFRILQQQAHWLGMAFSTYGTFPTGDPARFLGEGRITGGGNLIVEHDFKVLNVGLNGGYHYRGDAEVASVNIGDAWKMGAGISRKFNNGLSFSVEYWSSWFDSGSVDRFQANPMEVMGTLRYQFGAGPRLIAGAGGGGTSGVGCPAYRMAAGVDYYYCKPEITKLKIRVVDEDGKALKGDLIIEGPENLDTKTDAKGKWYSEVKAGNFKIKATKDNYDDGNAKVSVEYGKTTKVKIVLHKLGTRLTVIVTDKFSGEKLNAKVVFDLNTDKEKLLLIPEGKITKSWKPGKYALMVSSKGYETKFEKTNVIKDINNVVHVKLRKKIEKIGKIYFDFDSDVIRKQSYPILDDVVSKIKSLGKFDKIIIEGHCSYEGTDEYNMSLSKRRALSVKKYLISKGINGEKLEIKPFGESLPIASNENEEGRAENRRVEFIIEE